MKKIAAIFTLSTGIALSSAHAVMLVGWDLPGATASTNVAASAAATGVIGGNMSNNVGLTRDTASAARWQFSSFNQTGTDEAAMTNALAGNDSWALSLSASNGYSLTVRGVGPFTFYRSGSGPKNIALLYSTSSTFSTYSVVATNANTGTNSVTTDFSTNAAWTNFATPITVAEGTTGYFRIVGYGASGSGGTGGYVASGTIDFSLNGDVNSLGMYTWTGGVGSWAPGVAANWQAGGASAAWVNGKDASFASGGDLAIDAGGVSAGLLTLSGSTPVTLTGGTLTASSIAAGSASVMNLNGGAVTVSGNVDLTDASISGGNLSVGGILSASISTGSTSISTALGGNGSLSKSGAGELILSRTNSFIGTTAVVGGTLTTGASEILSDTASLQVSSGATFKLGGNETVGGLNAVFGSFINLQGNTLTAGANNLGFTNGATITGTGSLVKNGTGQMYMNNSTNTFSGGFTLNSGDVTFTSSGTASAGILSNSVFGTGTLTLNGGTITSSSAASGRTVYNNIVLNGNVQFGNSAWGSTNVQMNSSTSTSTNTNTGVVTTNTNYTPLFTASTNTSATTTLQGDTTINTLNWVDWYQPINGNFRLTKSGTGALSALNNYLLLRASNNIAGVTVASGILSYKNRNALGSGTVILSNGVALAQDGLINNSPLTGNDQTDRAIPNNIRLDGDVTFGSLGQANHLGGNLDLNGGTSRVITLGNTTYLYGEVTNGGQLVIDNGTGTGSRTFAMFAAGNYTGGTVVRTNAALAVGHDLALGSGDLIFTNTSGSGSAILRASTLTTNATQVRTIQNNIQLANGSTAVLDSVTSAQNSTGTNVNVTVDMVLSGNISGAGGLTKSNNNTVTLRGANSYSGATTVVNGTLVAVTNNISASITSNNVVITFSNNPANGTYAILPGALNGTYTATYSNLGSSKTATFSSASPASVTVTSVKLNQAITFGSLAPVKVGNANFSLMATADSSLPVTYVSSDPTVASVSGNVVTILKAGSTTITASQAGNADYNAASPVAQSLTVNKGDQSITGLAASVSKTYGDSAYNLNVTKGASSSSLTFSSDNTSVATVSAGQVTIVGAGSTTIRVNQAGDDNYMAASEVTQVLTVAKATPSISVAPTASAITSGQSLSSSTLSGGTGSVAGSFAWTSPSTAPSSSGSFSVTFTPTDSANYNTATTNVSVTVNGAGPTFDGAYSGKNLTDVAQNGLTYLMNYAFGGSDTTEPKLPVQDTADSTKLALVAYVRTGDTSLSVGGQAAASLDFSSPSSATYEVITPSDAPAGMEKRRYSVEASGDRQFLRLIVTKQ